MVIAGLKIFFCACHGHSRGYATAGEHTSRVGVWSMGGWRAKRRFASGTTYSGLILRLIVVLNGSGMGSSTRLEAQNDERDVIRLARADRSLGPSRKASEQCIGKCIR